MLKLSSGLFKIPIISLRTSGQIGLAERPIINPNNLKIEGWFARSVYEGGLQVLPSNEIREISRLGIAVNDYESMTNPNELVRMQQVLNLDFQIIGKNVVTKSRKKLGKVIDYSTDLDSYFIQTLYVIPKALKAFTKDQLSVSRQQIIEITDKKIIIKDIEATESLFFKLPTRVPESQAPA